MKLRRLSLSRAPRPGDPCPVDGCGGLLTVYHTHVAGESRVRYLECDVCREKPVPNKQIVPIEAAPPRPARRPRAA